jgi:hypothetical protein
MRDAIPLMQIMSVDIRHPPRVLQDHHIRFTQLVSEIKRSGSPDKRAITLVPLAVTARGTWTSV